MQTKQLLLVVDVQNGFVSNAETKEIIPRINSLTKFWQEHAMPVVFSRFINRADSPWARYTAWNKMLSSPEIDLHSSLSAKYGETYDKTSFSAWSDEVSQVCRANQVEEVVLCGIDIDQCVLASALDVFEAGLCPIIITDCCASSAGSKFHDASLMLLGRLIGEDQLIQSTDILHSTP